MRLSDAELSKGLIETQLAGCSNDVASYNCRFQGRWGKGREESFPYETLA